jgi:hypothetical protein
MAFQGGSGFAYANQESHRFTAGLEEPEHEEGSRQTTLLTMCDPCRQIYQEAQPSHFMPAMKHRKRAERGLDSALIDESD